MDVVHNSPETWAVPPAASGTGALCVVGFTQDLRDRLQQLVRAKGFEQQAAAPGMIGSRPVMKNTGTLGRIGRNSGRTPTQS